MLETTSYRIAPAHLLLNKKIRGGIFYNAFHKQNIILWALLVRGLSQGESELMHCFMLIWMFRAHDVIIIIIIVRA